MVKLRPRPPQPPTLESIDVLRSKEDIEQKVKNGEKLTSADFPHYWTEDDVRGTLWRHQHSKCCYCERKRELKRESDLEHYRPTARIAEEQSHPGYWWLAYEWTNYLIACKPCNQAHKRNCFPLLPNGARAWRPSDSLSAEKPALMNPVDDHPEDCIGFDWQGSGNILVKAVGLDDEGRGSATIDLTGLNRFELMQERSDLILLLEAIATKMKVGLYFAKQGLVGQAAQDIKRETAPQKEFAGFRRAFFRKLMLSNYVSTD